MLQDETRAIERNTSAEKTIEHGNVFRPWDTLASLLMIWMELLACLDETRFFVRVNCSVNNHNVRV